MAKDAEDIAKEAPIRSTLSTIALIFSIILICGMIFTNQTQMAIDIHPAFSFGLGVGAITWLTMVEGTQGSLVGLTPINRDLYKDSHPWSWKCTGVTNKGDNLDRYLMGRQLMVCFIVFIINMSFSPIGGASLWGLPDTFNGIFYGSGLVMILFTCMVGQLNSQVNASLCMLDYINNWFAVGTLWTAMAIEFTGILHASYVIQLAVGMLAGKPIVSNEEPRNGLENLFFWARCLFSLAVLGFCFAVTLVALFEGKTTMWEGVPPGLAVVVFFFLMSVVGMLEAMQIAFFAVAKLQASERGSSAFALKTSHLLYSGEGTNLAGFMIGRQLCVVSCMFFVARVASVAVPEGESRIFDAGDALHELMATGLLGALALTIVGSIAWQLVASAFPIAFMSNPITYFLLRICLLLEQSGICYGAWVLAMVHKKIAGFQRDEVYVGTAEQRAAMEKGDTTINIGAGHIVPVPAFVSQAPPALKDLMAKDASIRTYLNQLYEKDGKTAPGV